MKILVTGATGLVGRALASYLTERGHQVIRLVRSPDTAAAPPCWDPAQDRINLGDAPGFEAVIHLAGESIAGRWTAAKKTRIRDSRVNGTRLLCEALAALASPPGILLAASATGFYGNQGDVWLDERSPAGTGFLADVCQEWEAATQPATAAGVRVAHVRFGIVLAAEGGALGKMLPVFRAGLGGRVGSGRQFWSWITLADVLGVIGHSLADNGLRGPVNVVAPNPVANAQFTAALAGALRRPAVLPLPAFAARWLVGEMADAALLASARVRPARLLESGFRFQHPELEPALRQLLG